MDSDTPVPHASYEESDRRSDGRTTELEHEESDSEVRVPGGDDNDPVQEPPSTSNPISSPPSPATGKSLSSSAPRLRFLPNSFPPRPIDDNWPHSPNAPGPVPLQSRTRWVPGRGHVSITSDTVNPRSTNDNRSDLFDLAGFQEPSYECRQNSMIALEAVSQQCGISLRDSRLCASWISTTTRTS